VIKKAEQTKGDVGIVLCDCAGTLRSRLDFDQLTEHLSGLEEVATVKLCSKFCQQKDCTKTIKSLKQTERLVIGACDREIFDNTLQEAIQSVNLNDGLLWSVNYSRALRLGRHDAQGRHG